MITKSFSTNITLSGNSLITVPNGGSVFIPLPLTGVINEQDYILSAILSIGIVQLPSNPQNIKLVIDNFTSDSVVDYSTVSGLMADIKLEFDITRYLSSSVRDHPGILVLKNDSGSSITLKRSGISNKLTGEYIPFINLPQKNSVLSFSQNNYKIKYNYVTSELLIKKPLIEKALLYDVSMCFSNSRLDDYYSFFPKGWKLNLLEFLSFSNGVPYLYVDKNNHPHELVRVSDESEYFYTNDGSGLILEMVDDPASSLTTYKLFCELTSKYKIFDSSGRIISAKLDDVGGGRFLNYSYSTDLIEISDSNGNEINISYSDLDSTIALRLNNILLYVFAKDESNRLLSITKGNSVDSFTYPHVQGLGDCSIELSDNHKIIYSSGHKIFSFYIKYGSNTVESYSFKYDYKKIYITDRHGVTMYYAFDDNFELSSKGEVVEDEDETLIYYHQNDKLVRELALSLKYSIGRKYKTINSEDSIALNASSNALETFTLTPSANFKIEEGKTYVLMAKLQKNSDVVLRANRSVDVILKQAGTDNTVASIVFDSYHTSQYACTSFRADFTEGNSYSEIVVQAKNLYSFSGATISDIYLIEIEKQLETFYVRKEPGDNLDTTDLIGPISIDGYDWYEITTNFDGYDHNNNPISRHYSYRDLMRNYINAERGDSFFWDEDNTRLTLSEIYSFRRRIIHAPANSVFARKILKKSYIDNNVEKEIYSFEYLLSDYDPNLDENIFVRKTILCYDEQNYSIIQKYSLDLKLVDERTASPTYYKRYLYDQNNCLTRLFSSKSDIGWPAYIDEMSYDSLFRIQEVSSYYQNSLETKSFEYIDEYEIVSSFIDENGVETSYLYDPYLNKNTQISCENMQITKQYDENSLATISNGTTFVFNVDSYGFRSGFSVDNEFSIQKEIALSINDVVIEGNVVATFNKYGKVQTIAEREYNGNNYQDNVFVKYLYFNEKPSDIESITSQESFPVSFGSKLYKIINIDNFIGIPTIYFDYDDQGRLKEIKQDATNIEFKINYDYDALDRLSNRKVSFQTNQFVDESYEYQNISTTINAITYSTTGLLNVGNILYEECTKDYLNRNESLIFKNGDNLGSNEIRHKTSFTYCQKFISPKNRTSNLIESIDYYDSEIIQQDGNTHASYLYTISQYITYTSKGFVSSIRYGKDNVSYDNTGADYYYDEYDQLVSETNYELGQIINYSYDLNGNISSVTKINLSTNQVISTESYSYSNIYKDKLVSFDSMSVSYDSNMNITNIFNRYSFSWERNRQLGEAQYLNGIYDDYYYNHEGIRIAKIDSYGNTHRYILDGHRIVGERISGVGGHKYIAYLYGQNGITGMIYNSHVYYYRKNVLGDVIALYDGNTLIAKYIYDAYGNHVVRDENDNLINDPEHVGRINPFRYRGYYYDDDVKLYYCNSRYYCPLIRRWLSIDTPDNLDPDSLLGINLFAYCKNNPIAYVDPEGTISSFLLGIIIGAIVGAAVGTTFGIIEVINEGKTGWEAVKHVLIKMFTGALSGAVAGIGAVVGSSLAVISFSFAGEFIGSTLESVFLDLNDYGYVKSFPSSLFVSFESGSIAGLFSMFFYYLPIKALTALDKIIKEFVEGFVAEIFEDKLDFVG